MVWAYPTTKNGVKCGEIQRFSDIDWERLCKQPATPRRWKVTDNPNKTKAVIYEESEGYRIVEPANKKSDLKTVADKGSKKKKL